MATDPAFAVGVLAVLARRAPSGVRLLLLAIATVDGVLAVVVIAAGYNRGLAWFWLAAALAGCLLVALARWCGVTASWPYLPLGAAVWYANLRSGINPSIAGVCDQHRRGRWQSSGPPARRVTARHVIGLGLVCGLGFTVALFVTELAFHDPALTDHAKISILAAAVLCGAAAALVLATGPHTANRAAGVAGTSRRPLTATRRSH